MAVDHWTEFYRGGALVTCATGTEPGYSGAVEQVWRDFFRALPAGARIVDIGSGNGAIPAIAIDVSRTEKLDFGIHATDLAEIDPVEHVPDGRRLFAGVHFHPGVPAHELPFANASVTAVTGHYALEYTDVADTLREIARVLAPRGHALFIIHHADSVVVRNALESLGHAELLLEQERVFQRLREFFGVGPASDAAAAKAAELNAISARLRDVAAASMNPFLINETLQSLQQLFDARLSAAREQIVALLRGNEEALRNSRRRWQDLAAAAVSEDGFTDIMRQAERNGLAVTDSAEQYQDDGTLLAWRLRLRSP
ncbi:MAG: methyltransferase domain-containing protein [Woeseiaceae bacterium]|nr:methyltransferase domain-containing protein [Woeseiaceae bacterium]